MGVTIRDVARRAGVSISTVSRVLNDTCPVSADKRERVEEAVSALGYTPNPAARSLLKQKTGGLGVLLPFISGEFFAELLSGIDETTQQHGFFLMVSSSHRSEKEFRAALKGLYKRVDGLLIMAPEMVAEAIQDQVSPEQSVVFLNTRVETAAFDAINFDNFGGAYAATRHLIDLGHRRIAHVAGLAEAYDARERLRGYRTALREAGLDAPDELVVNGNFTQDGGYEAALVFLAMDPRPTAIVAANDLSAIGVMHALREVGLKIPNDVSVTGFDDVLSTKFTTPPLTTVHVPIREIGRAAIRRLLERVQNSQNWTPEQYTMPVDLVVRQSTAELGADAAPGRRFSAA